MKDEIDALKSNGTWIIIELVTDAHVVGYKWVYKIKLQADGSVERFKSCLVAKCYNQI